MGGLGPGIGGMEYVVIAVVALLVVGPERLPGMLRKLGQMVAKARNMANEFRSSFDEMARQSELDELRKEVDALRRGQSNMMPLGAEAEATFRSIRDDLNAPVTTTPAIAPSVTEPDMLAAPDEWPDSQPVLEPLEAEPAPKPAKAKPKPASAKTAAKPTAAKASTKASTKNTPAKTTAARAAPKPRATRKKAVEL